jgi:hypothetical protein
MLFDGMRLSLLQFPIRQLRIVLLLLSPVLQVLLELVIVHLLILHTRLSPLILLNLTSNLIQLIINIKVVCDLIQLFVHRVLLFLHELNIFFTLTYIIITFFTNSVERRPKNLKILHRASEFNFQLFRGVLLQQLTHISWCLHHHYF